MALSPYVPTTRVSGEKIVLKNGQFARWLARRTGASHMALSSALRLVSTGLIEALASGYDVQLYGLGTFETRELKPRKRYHRLNKTTYISKPSVIVHFKKSEKLSDRVRSIASAQLTKTAETPTVSPITNK